jgi:hypothetical protein|tara:strand:- start:441 stop:866 length:426 start_codon:yes stop_codon:yes gene_type:complete
MAIYDASAVNKSKRLSRIYKDLDMDFAKNPTTKDVATVEDVVAVKRAVRNLVQTNFYERPFHPELGCGIRELLFENYDPITGVFLKRKIGEVLTNYEPRIDVQQISIDDDPDRNRLVCDIQFYVKGTQDPVSVTTYLQRLR